MPLCFYPYASAFYLHPFDHTPSIISLLRILFSRSLGIYLFNALFRYPYAPYSISKKEKYRIIPFVSSLPLRKVSCFFFFFFYIDT